MKLTMMFCLLMAAPTFAADVVPNARLATVRKAWIEPIDDLKEDKPVSACAARLIAERTPLTLAETREDADIILYVRANIPGTAARMFLGPTGGSPSSYMIVQHADGTTLWEDGAKYRRATMRASVIGAHDQGKSIECGLAEGLLDRLRDAMRKARGK
jgi:hypothetical protein